MPLHRWSIIAPGIFHDFHTVWISEIRNALNGGLLPPDCYALSEQHMGGFVADVLTLHVPPNLDQEVEHSPSVGQVGGTAVASVRPSVRVRESVELDLASMRRSIAIRHVSMHRIVALIEIVSPANKDREEHIANFVQKTTEALSRGIHVMVIDLFPAGRFDPHGIHYKIRESLVSYLPTSEPNTPASTLASYRVTPKNIDMFVEHVEPVEPLLDMPIYLDESRYVNVPLEQTYQRSWAGVPDFWRKVILGEIRE